jgi:microcystin-dependent protein
VTQIPSHDHDVYLKDLGHDHDLQGSFGGAGGGGGPIASFNSAATPHSRVNSSITGITIGSISTTANDNKTATKGGGQPHKIVQPTIICNYIIRII